MSTSIVGKDVWWDSGKQLFRKKRLDLEKIPLKFRCPNCGKVVVKRRNREPLTIRDEQAGKIKSAEIRRLLKLEKPPHSEWNDFVERHKELFEVDLIEIPWDRTLWVFYGGVCKDCYLDGFGEWGDYGGFIGAKVKDRREKGRLAYEKDEQEKIAKYGKEPKYWLDPGFTKNPEYEAWWQRKIAIDREDARRKNAKFVESEVVPKLTQREASR